MKSRTKPNRSKVNAIPRNYNFPLDGWANFLQNKISSYDRIEYGIAGIILTIYTILITVTVAFLSILLAVVTISFIIIFAIAGTVVFVYFDRRKKACLTILDEIIGGKYKRGQEVYQRWLTLFPVKR